jgi:hypothetical protein
MKSIVFDIDYIPHFSGHETFPLRQMWLKKAFEATLSEKKGVFSNDDAIVTFGVGKNMVSSIKHWAVACGVVESNNGTYIPTEFGKKLFGAGGMDPYCEQYSTSWLIHWKLAGLTEHGPKATTWYLAFNHMGLQNFSSIQLQNVIEEYLNKKSPKIKVSSNTLGRDVEVFLRTYIAKPSTSMEDVTEPMLAELGLIQLGMNGLYEFRRGPKSTLSDSVFFYALLDFWAHSAPDQKSLSFESIAYDAGSPGRVFKLDEDSVAEKLIALNQLTNGKYNWSDTAGQRNLYCINEMSPIEALGI